MANHILIRNDTAANWAADNPILEDGEMGIQDGATPLMKIGDGVRTWSQLPYSGAPAPTGANVPTPQTGDAGKVVTVNADATGFELDQGGTSVQTDRAIYPVAAAVADGSNIEWAAASTSHGRSLLDLTDPLNPTVTVGGIYAVTVALFPDFSAGKHAGFQLNLDGNNDDPTIPILIPLDPVAGDGVAQTFLSATYYIPLGGVIYVAVSQDTGAPLNLHPEFGAYMVLQLIG